MNEHEAFDELVSALKKVADPVVATDIANAVFGVAAEVAEQIADNRLCTPKEPPAKEAPKSPMPLRCWLRWTDDSHTRLIECGAFEEGGVMYVLGPPPDPPFPPWTRDQTLPK